jgi:hypothetical protein
MADQMQEKISDKEIEDKKGGNQKEIRVRARSLINAELLFILLPFIVVGIIFSSKGEFSNFIRAPEWSLASSILIGQSIVKLISGLLSKPRKVIWEKTAELISVMIVILLVPTLIILFLIMTTEIPSIGLIVAQFIFFFTSVLLFYYVGGLVLLRNVRQLRRVWLQTVRVA